MRALIINPRVLAQIERAKARALQKPISLETVKAGAVDPNLTSVKLSDRKPGARRPFSEVVFIPVGFRANISYEYQSVGLCRHLSLSVEPAGNIPNPEAIKLVAKAFGFRLISVHAWLEEFAPKHFAVNIVEPVDIADEHKA